MGIISHKELQDKAKKNKVYQWGEWTFEVVSGNSLESYWVDLTPHFRRGAVRYVTGTCTCDYGTAGLHSNPDGKVYWERGQRPASGCNHVFSAVAAKFGRRMSGWESLESAKRQHRPIFDVGDGVWLTGRAAPDLEKGRSLLRGETDWSELI